MDEQQHPHMATEELPAKVSDHKDEMNLAEFPLCCVADRADPNQKTLGFEDRLWDDKRGEMITRRLTITGSDEYGLPTALDDEVLLGLIQLSRLREFADRRVPFTRYQLIQLLGWRNESKNYERIEKSLNRWVGVTLYYENAWRDRGQQRWVNEKFHVLDNVTLFDRDHGSRQPQLPFSIFVWNDVLFRSFRAGNLKSLDFDFFKRLDSAIAKRLFRFLDKRFFHRRHWEFDLKELAWEHIGLARSYDAAGLKRKLRPAIAELERHGFLQPMADEVRFRKVTCGQWRVVFERARSTTPKAIEEVLPNSEVDALASALIERGVTPATAQETVTQHSLEQVRTQLEVFDWLVAHNDPGVSRNPPGFLISSIRSRYAPPQGFVTSAERSLRDKKAAERKHKLEQRQREQEARQQAQVRARDEAIERFWQSLSAEERLRLEQEALNEAKGLPRGILDRGGALAHTARKSILDACALKLMQVAG